MIMSEAGDRARVWVNELYVVSIKRARGIGNSANMQNIDFISMNPVIFDTCKGIIYD